jgi:molybdopterin molybdotransferase
MPEFLTLIPPQDARQVLLAALPAITDGYRRGRMELCPVPNALGRVTAMPVLAPEALPPFSRATVDGYAVWAGDTFGASLTLPAYLKLAGEVLMGQQPDFVLQKGECALIHTGGMMPEGADAVVMVEYCQPVDNREIEILRPVAVGENVIAAGEDVKPGDEILPAGKLLRPPELGGLLGLGILEVEVMRRPRVAICSTGDEIVPPDHKITPGQIRDINTYTLSALVQAAGGEAVSYGIIPDLPAKLEAITRQALDENDVLVISAGSSASTRDLTSSVIHHLGEPGVLVHGVNVRPGKPTILAVVGGKPVIGLPGNPVSALLIGRLFLVTLLEYLQGLPLDLPKPTIPARLTLNLSSTSGREDWVPVVLKREAGGYLAEPVFGKSNLIFTLAKADGWIRIPANLNGLPAGAVVDVHLL